MYLGLAVINQNNFWCATTVKLQLKTCVTRSASLLRSCFSLATLSIPSCLCKCSYRESGERCKLSQQDPEPSSGENGFLCIVCVEMVTVGNSSHFVGLKNFRLHFKKWQSPPHLELRLCWCPPHALEVCCYTTLWNITHLLTNNGRYPRFERHPV